MRKYLGLVVLIVASSYLPSVLAKTCAASATEKKLTGAAKSSFLKKCEKDARAACASDEVSQRTSGAAKDAHIKKCVKEAVGN